MNKADRSWIAYANDLDRRPAVIVPVPRDPTKPTLDYSAADTYMQHLQELVDTVVADQKYLPPSTVHIGRYQIGSAAEWSGTVAVLLDYAPEALSIGADLIAYAQLALAIAMKIRESRSHATVDDQPTDADPQVVKRPPSLNLPALLGLATEHYGRHYGSIDNVDVRWHARVPNVLGASVGHPVGNETYTFDVNTSMASYVYIVAAEGQALDHFYAVKDRIVPLQLPNWLDLDPFAFPQSWQTGWARIENT